MTFKNFRVALAIVAFTLGLAAGAAMVAAQDDDQPYIEYRQKLMDGQGASMASISDIMKYKLPYSAKHFALHAKNISDYAQLIPDAFEKQITAGPTDAKAEIWQNWDDFVAKSKTLADASAKFSQAAEAGGEMASLMPHLKAVGDACKGCHDTYRKPKEESFKQN
jgi:cytochrome c556